MLQPHAGEKRKRSGSQGTNDSVRPAPRQPIPSTSFTFSNPPNSRHTTIAATGNVAVTQPPPSSASYLLSLSSNPHAPPPRVSDDDTIVCGSTLLKVEYWRFDLTNASISASVGMDGTTDAPESRGMGSLLEQGGTETGTSGESALGGAGSSGVPGSGKRRRNMGKEWTELLRMRDVQVMMSDGIVERTRLACVRCRRLKTKCEHLLPPAHILAIRQHIQNRLFNISNIASSNGLTIGRGTGIECIFSPCVECVQKGLQDECRFDTNGKGRGRWAGVRVVVLGVTGEGENQEILQRDVDGGVLKAVGRSEIGSVKEGVQVSGTAGNKWNGMNVQGSKMMGVTTSDLSRSPPPRPLASSLLQQQQFQVQQSPSSFSKASGVQSEPHSLDDKPASYVLTYFVSKRLSSNSLDLSLPSLHSPWDKDLSRLLSRILRKSSYLSVEESHVLARNLPRTTLGIANDRLYGSWPREGDNMASDPRTVWEFVLWEWGRNGRGSGYTGSERLLEIEGEGGESEWERRAGELLRIFQWWAKREVEEVGTVDVAWTVREMPGRGRLSGTDVNGGEDEPEADGGVMAEDLAEGGEESIEVREGNKNEEKDEGETWNMDVLDPVLQEEKSVNDGKAKEKDLTILQGINEGQVQGQGQTQPPEEERERLKEEEK